MSAHIGDDAALYALGALEPHEIAAVEAHASACAACSRLLAQAEADVAAMAAAQRQLTPPPELAERIFATPDAPTQLRRSVSRASWIGALAAAIAVAIVPAAYFYEQSVAMHDAMLADANAMARVASSPHRRVAFTGQNASVMYAPDGSWYVVVIRGAKHPMHVTWAHDGEQTMLGTAIPHGGVAMLYLPKSHRMDQLAIMSDGRVVGQAQLVF